jgi:predicted nucleic acid-binding protein
VKLVVADSTPLINLAKIDRFELLKVLFDTLIIPDAVFEEVVVRGRNRPGQKELARAKWISIQKVSTTPLLTLLKGSLDKGEAEAIALAVERNADMILLDEAIGRQFAQQLGLRMRGTLGLLAEGYRRGLIDDLEAELNRLVSAGTWISPGLVAKVLEGI